MSNTFNIMQSNVCEVYNIKAWKMMVISYYIIKSDDCILATRYMPCIWSHNRHHRRVTVYLSDVRKLWTLFLQLSFNKSSFWIYEEILSKSYSMFPQYIKLVSRNIIKSRKIGLFVKWPLQCCLQRTTELLEMFVEYRGWWGRAIHTNQ